MEEEVTPQTPGASRPEQPSPLAHIKINLEPTGMGTGGSVPANGARTFVVIFGMMTMGIAGIVGSLLAVYLAASHVAAHVFGWLFGLALAELGFALAVTLLISRRDAPERHRYQGQPQSGKQPDSRATGGSGPEELRTYPPNVSQLKLAHKPGPASGSGRARAQRGSCASMTPTEN